MYDFHFIIRKMPCFFSKVMKHEKIAKKWQIWRFQIFQIWSVCSIQYTCQWKLVFFQFLHRYAKIERNIFIPQVLIFLKKVDVNLIVVKSTQVSNKLRGTQCIITKPPTINTLSEQFFATSHIVIIQILFVSWLLFTVHYVWLFYYIQTHGRNATDETWYYRMCSLRDWLTTSLFQSSTLPHFLLQWLTSALWCWVAQVAHGWCLGWTQVAVSVPTRWAQILPRMLRKTY